MIGCILIEMMLCLKIYDTEKKIDKTYTYKHADDFYGNTALQTDIIDAWEGLFEFVIASNCQAKDSANAKEQERKLENAIGKFQYQLTMKDGNGKDKTISNCVNTSNNLNTFPIYNLYKGYLNGDTYIKDWTNYYVDSYTEKYEKDNGYAYMDEDLINFTWLDINSIINGLCQENHAYSQYVAENIVENIQVYKDTIKECLYYFYYDDSNSNDKTITNNILKKLYSSMDKSFISTFKNRIADEYLEDKEYLTYDKTTGLVYSDDTECYYYMSEDNSIKCYDELNAKLLSRFEKEMDEQDKKQEPLTKEEKNTLIETISKAIYIGDNGLDSDAQILIPIAAVLGTPEEYTMYIGVDDALYQATQAVYMDQYSVTKEKADIIEKQERTYIFTLLGVLVFLGLVVLALLYVCGRKEGTEEIQYLAIDAWYTEIQVIFIILGIIAGIACMAMVADAFSYNPLLFSKENVLIVLMALALTAIILIEFLCSIVRKIKGGILIHQSFFGKIFRVGQEKLYYEKTSKRIMISYLVMCAVWFFFEYIAICLAFYEHDYSFLIFMQLILVFLLASTAIFLHRYLHQWDQIRNGVKRIKAGEINYQIPTNDSKKLLNLFAKDINSLSEGLENAVDEMLKSEKLKTELISNVSHDIKTPLTSIITYVDLIKKEDVQPDKVKEYVEVLDQKSQRLKTLTDDLFEAAKATSGVMKMEATQIDLGSLVNQAIGEFSEKLEKSDLNVRNNIESDSFYVMADGKLTWRIMENLLGNVSKYALTGSRVYIDATDTGNMISLTIKNISNTELNISAEELMERFTRGDQSRNTEGSGLGLNIAQSLAALQGGEFHVEIDGDLFKAMLELPKAKTDII